MMPVNQIPYIRNDGMLNVQTDRCIIAQADACARWGFVRAKNETSRPIGTTPALAIKYFQASF